MTFLEIKNIHKSYNNTHALRGVSFNISEGEIVAILGPSGCGKSTLLSVIAGLEMADKGDICWNGKSITHIPTHQRGFGLMFQDYMLFPHKNVHSNIAFGLEMLKWDRDKINERVEEILKFIGLSGYGSRDINTLSGGEQQRIALARSLAPNPRLLMLDEPFSSLDRTLRERLLYELKNILNTMKQTALYVTHDQEEAFALANLVVLMNLGEVIQVGTPEEIYKNPASVFVTQFLGFKNLFIGTIYRDTIQTPIGDFRLPDPHKISESNNLDGKLLTVLFRPDAFRLEEFGTHTINGIIKERTFRGSLSRLVLSVDGHELTFEFNTAFQLPNVGEKVTLHFNPQEAIQLYEDDK